MVLSLAAAAAASSSSFSSSGGGNEEGHPHVQSAVDASIAAMTNHALTCILRDDPTTGDYLISPNLI